jgi:hypothetical protein
MAAKKQGTDRFIFGIYFPAEEPIFEPTKEELHDMLHQLDRDGVQVDSELWGKLAKLLMQLLWGKRRLLLSAQENINWIRAHLFSQGIEAVGWTKAGAWAPRLCLRGPKNLARISPSTAAGFCLFCGLFYLRFLGLHLMIYQIVSADNIVEVVDISGRPLLPCPSYV